MSAAAELIGRSRLPLVTGLSTDVAGIKAAVALAQIAGGAIDHAASNGIYPLISAMRDSGMMLAAPSEIRRRADRVLVVGDDAFEDAPDMPDYLFYETPDLGEATRGVERQVLWLGAGDDMPDLPESVALHGIDCAGDDLLDALSAIRAELAGHQHGAGPLPAPTVQFVAEWLKEAAFGCAIFAPANLDSLTIEMLAGLVFDLNAETRFTSLPMLRADQAFAAAQATTWTTGFPLRSGFGRGYPDHDPHLYRGERLIADGEADLAVHVAALDGQDEIEPEWSATVPVVALCGEATDWSHPPKIAFAVATAGRDHDSVLYDNRFGGFVPVAASQAGEDAGGRMTAAAVLAAIAAHLGQTTTEATA
ncbi:MULTISPECIES: hypothetical protein [Aurantimonas]|uniref:hypothetical protein n=1 Tax=Aurantimonas TaxID=182269 RepID=UPI000408685D|nr:hypothetical protein [Aurantimonas coralicida]